MSDLVSVSLSHVPFLNSCDVSRLQMVSKYFGGQAVPHITNEIPKLLPLNAYKTSIYSDRFIKFAEDDGIVVYSNNDLMIVYYNNLNEFEDYYIPEYKFISSHFATKLRNKLSTGVKFNKGDILYEYAGFINGIPAPGFNARVAFMTLNLMNYEDAIILSESFAKKFKYYSYDEIVVPIYNDDILKNNAKHKLLPDIGDVYEENEPVISVGKYDDNSLINFLISLSNSTNNDLSEKCEINKGRVVDLKVIRVNFSKHVKHTQTAEILEREYRKLSSKIEDVEKELKNYINDKKFINKIINKYFKIKRTKSKDIRNVNELVYIIKVKLIYEEDVWIGDKFSTRGANKGVTSIIIPDELMPKDQYGNTIDIILSPFAIPSRMNVNQIYEMYLSELVLYAEYLLLRGDISKAFEIILDITEKFGKKVYPVVKNYIKNLENNDRLLELFISDVRKNGLYILVDDFKDKKSTKYDILKLYEKYNLPTTHKVKVNPFRLSKFISNQERKYLPDKEVEIEAFVGTMYMYRLFKIARYLLNARSIGPYHRILKIPTKGKSNQGGSRIGNNELDMLLSYDSKYLLKEFITIKADDHEHKMEFINSLVSGDDYSIKNIKSESYTNLVIESLAKTMFVDINLKDITSDKNHP
jgi:DNA-directed RNA polymerase beta subunit